MGPGFESLRVHQNKKDHESGHFLFCLRGMIGLKHLANGVCRLGSETIVGENKQGRCSNLTSRKGPTSGIEWEYTIPARPPKNKTPQSGCLIFLLMCMIGLKHLANKQNFNDPFYGSFFYIVKSSPRYTFFTRGSAVISRAVPSFNIFPSCRT